MLSTSSGTPLQPPCCRWELSWSAAPHGTARGHAGSSRGAGSARGLPRAGTPALFVPPAASEAFIRCVKCRFQSAFWWASGSVATDWEIQAAYKTCPGLTSQPARAG